MHKTDAGSKKYLSVDASENSNNTETSIISVKDSTATQKFVTSRSETLTAGEKDAMFLYTGVRVESLKLKVQRQPRPWAVRF